MYGLLSKLLLYAVGFAAVAIALHTAIGAWRSDIQEKELLRIANDKNQIEIAQRDEEYRLLQESVRAKDQEVQWARNYVAKQTETIERLKESASIEVRECLDLQIDSRFVQ